MKVRTAFSLVTFSVISSLSLGQEREFRCNNKASEFLEQVTGNWLVTTKDRISPGEYEENSGYSTISQPISGCGVHESFRGTYKGQQYAREVTLIGVDSVNIQMTARDSEHNSISLFNGRIDNNVLTAIWYRDPQTRRLQSKYLLTLFNENSFEFSSYLSTDHGKTWALTHERKYIRSGSTDGLQPYFTALIVSDIENSIQWYRDVLGFKVKNKIESEERGFRMANLEREGSLLELIELQRALNPGNVIQDYSERTRLLGIFKTGFQVNDFDQWILRLQQQEVEFYGGIVTDPVTSKKMTIITDPDGNRIQLFAK